MVIVKSEYLRKMIFTTVWGGTIDRLHSLEMLDDFLGTFIQPK